jgi:arsenite methyltransferase
LWLIFFFTNTLTKVDECEDPMSELTEAVRAKYSTAALRVMQGTGRGGCCGGGSSGGTTDPVTRDLYEAVLDLGSGGGIDVLLSARRVGPAGKAYGLDMTDEMLALARENQRKAGVENVEFLRGEIEAIPLPDESVDVIISNCVINLSGDKDRVLAEAFRVLRRGGRFAVSDVVTRGTLPEAARASIALWTGCVAGALDEQEYVGKLAAAGFVEAAVEPTRVYSSEDVRSYLGEAGLEADSMARQLDGRVMGAFIRARKPS